MSLFSGLFTGARTQGVTALSPQQAYERMLQPAPYILLDVRTPEEYRQGHIGGAKLIPVDELDRRAGKELPDKTMSILVYCRSGARAGRAADMLVKMGYAQVSNFGGILDWPYEIVKG